MKSLWGAFEKHPTRIRGPILGSGKGILISWSSVELCGNVTVCDGKGRLVTRELNGITICRSGRFEAFEGLPYPKADRPLRPRRVLNPKPSPLAP